MPILAMRVAIIFQNGECEVEDQLSESPTH